MISFTWLKRLFSKASTKMSEIQSDVLQSTLPAAGAATPVVDPNAAGAAPGQVAQTVTVQDSNAGAVTEVVPPQPAPAPAAPEAASEKDVMFNRVKVLLKVADHAIDEVWDDSVAYVKKAAKTEEEIADKLETILLVAGHDVSDVLADAIAFAKKY
ncbi:hypothetical protein [Martelella alba]|uniref:Uncharacterized protein n=1 Tax=Martelella alba TaxID=2590451 RepID=A0ABY2SSG5_9HYPH|nr:hypothetical protein [Martelella alba]TKI08651.1 hypothetical protein FCN80_00950 [Martelella alba]